MSERLPVTHRIEPYFLSHAERGESFQNQDFVGGMQKRRRFAAAPLGFRKPISDFCGDDCRNFEPKVRLSYGNVDRIIRKLRGIYQETPDLFDVPTFAQKVY